MSWASTGWLTLSGVFWFDLWSCHRVLCFRSFKLWSKFWKFDFVIKNIALLNLYRVRKFIKILENWRTLKIILVIMVLFLMLIIFVCSLYHAAITWVSSNKSTKRPQHQKPQMMSHHLNFRTLLTPDIVGHKGVLKSCVSA